jgi:Xaa-Pro aminopeptidase
MLLAFCACLLVPVPVSTASNAPAPLISVAPAAPEVDEATWRAELAARRARVAEQVGPKSVVVLFSGEARVYTGDTDYEFRQENNLYYLTRINQENVTLVMLPGNAAHPEILFLPRRRPEAETWTGHMLGADEAQRLSGVQEIWEAKEFTPFMEALRARRAYTPKAMQQGEAKLYLLRVAGGGESHEYAREQKFAAELSAPGEGFVVRNAAPIFAEMRLRKSPLELQMLQHAVDISIEAHERAQAAAARAGWEYEIEAEVDYTLKRRHADNWGYPNIVGCGANATTLHYDASQGRCAPGQLALMDVGAEYEHYSADVTRTFPVNGRFSPAQAEVYNAVLTAQEKAMSVVRPGANFSDMHNAALEVIKDSLLKLGLITERNSPQYRLWYMHSTSHFIGMNVHDVGRPAKLEPNMVFTIEPGIYVCPDALDNLPDTPENRKFKDAVRPAFERYKGIGVRVEDDILVTPDGYRNMSAALPRTITDIENFHARAARELHHVPPH